MMGFGGLGIIIIIAAVYFLSKFLFDDKNKQFTNRETPLDILKKRFAGGDISKEEFKEKSVAVIMANLSIVRKLEN